MLLAEGLSDPALKKFYLELARSENGHQALFVRLACAVGEEATVLARLEALLEAEGDLVRSLPLRAAVH